MRAIGNSIAICVHFCIQLLVELQTTTRRSPMRLWQRSIQWQLILSMGAALLASILIVVGIYSAVVDRLTERYLIEEALPARVLAIRNDLERVLTAPVTANASIAENRSEEHTSELQ